VKSTLECVYKGGTGTDEDESFLRADWESMVEKRRMIHKGYLD